MKLFALILVLALTGCGSTIRLDYSGKGGDVGIGFTFPERQLPAKKGLQK